MNPIKRIFTGNHGLAVFCLAHLTGKPTPMDGGVPGLLAIFTGRVVYKPAAWDSYRNNGRPLAMASANGLAALGGFYPPNCGLGGKTPVADLPGNYPILPDLPGKKPRGATIGRYTVQSPLQPYSTVHPRRSGGLIRIKSPGGNHC